MNIFNFVEELQISQLESFAKKTETSWGYFFCDENNPNYYDANHAHVKSVPGNVSLVIDEVITFYEGKKLIPRFYIYNIDNQTELIKELKERCFGFEQFIDPIQLWNNILIENTVDNNITIEKVTAESFNDALTIRGNISELGGKEVISKSIDKLWVFPINEKVEKVYEKYGLETIDSMKTGHAFLGGQSINEIRGD